MTSSASVGHHSASDAISKRIPQSSVTHWLGGIRRSLMEQVRLVMAGSRLTRNHARNVNPQSRRTKVACISLVRSVGMGSAGYAWVGKNRMEAQTVMLTNATT